MCIRDSTCSQGVESLNSDQTLLGDKHDLLFARLQESDDSANASLFRLFGILHAAEMSCLQEKIEKNINDPDYLSDFKKKLKALREVTQNLGHFTRSLSDNSDLSSGKICPSTKNQLETDFGNRKDSFYFTCQKILTARGVRQVLLASFDYTELPPIKDFLDSYSKMPPRQFRLNYHSPKVIIDEISGVFADSKKILKDQQNQIEEISEAKKIRKKWQKSLWLSLIHI